MRSGIGFSLPLVALILLAAMPACKHSPFLPVDAPPPNDSTTTEPPPPPNDSTTFGQPCEPGRVYFQRDVLPILRSNCAFSGCHDAATAQEGVILESYSSVMLSEEAVTPFDPEASKILRRLTDDEEDERMPPPPRVRLSPAQIQLIRDWIAQGAQDLRCEEDPSTCDTSAVSFAQDLQPVLQNNCRGCHSGPNPPAGVDLSNYPGVKTVADNGKLLGVLFWANGFPRMPQGGAQLAPCTLEKFRAWVEQGAPNN